MFESLLIANRGEIACRVISTARQLGIRTIAVFSEADRSALHVEMADEAYLLGPAPARESYLNIERIIEVARKSSAQAIHPGYGFLSENAEFARACQDAGVVFVGPTPSAIEAMGSKLGAKQMMEAARVPILPGYHGEDQSDDVLLLQAGRTGYPLLIKASAGGGGKGMRLVENESEFVPALQAARREALNAFGDDRVLLERFLRTPKHIEVQVLADTHGNVIYLGERDCSVQRRHQKVVEEAPGPTISEALRRSLGEQAVRAAQQVDYVGAGTVEFIADGDDFYFMEMNTRLQVEHPVTEAITGIDLVEQQLKVANGEALTLEQSDVELKGHAIEVRVYAENPAKNFLPSTGLLLCFDVTGDVRLDTGVRAGDEVTMHYDPMLAKVIAYGPDRAAALDRLKRSLAGTRIAGVQHNVGYLLGLLQHPGFVSGEYTTALAEDVHDAVLPKAQTTMLAQLGAHLMKATPSLESNPWCVSDGFRMNGDTVQRVHTRLGKQAYEVTLSANSAQVRTLDTAPNGMPVVTTAEVETVGLSQGHASVIREGLASHVMFEGHTEVARELTDDLSRYVQQDLAGGGVTAPMPGVVTRVLVKSGDKVKRGQQVAIVEAMKMEHTVVCSEAGTVGELFYAEGDRVEEGVALMEVLPA